MPFVGGALLLAFGWQATLALFGIPALVIGVLLAIFVHEDHAAYRRQARAAGSVRAQLREVIGRRDLRLILGASLVAAGGRGLDIVAPFMVLYLSGPLDLDDGDGAAPLRAPPRRCRGRAAHRRRPLRPASGAGRRSITYYLLSAVGILAFVAAGANLLFLVPLLIPFGTAVFSESPVLQAYLADRATGPMRDVAFAVYFTFAFGIGAFWAYVIGFVVDEFSYPIAFGVMAASYVAAALLLVAVRERAEGAASA